VNYLTYLLIHCVTAGAVTQTSNDSVVLLSGRDNGVTKRRVGPGASVTHFVECQGL